MTLEHDLDRRQRNTANQLRMYVGFIRAKTDPREMLKAMEEMGKLMGLYSHKLEIAVEAPRTPEEVEQRRLELIDELVGRGLIEPPKNGSE